MFNVCLGEIDAIIRLNETQKHKHESPNNFFKSVNVMRKSLVVICSCIKKIAPLTLEMCLQS